MKLFFNKKINRKVVGFITSLAVVITTVCLAAIMGLSFLLKTRAEYTPVNNAETFSNSATVTFANATMLVDYSWHYNHTTGFASAHQYDTLIFGFTGDSDISSNFEGIGSASYPFGGELRFGGENYQVHAHGPLFNYVYDSVKLLNAAGTDSNPIQENVVFVRLSDVGENESKPLLAEHIIHDTRNGKSSAEWQITLDASSAKSYSGLIGEIGENAAVNVTYTNNSSAGVMSNTAVGAICGVMQNGSSLDLTYSAPSSFNVTSSGGNAGGLVGTMKGNAGITVKSIPSVAVNVESTVGYAGGLVGELTSDNSLTNSTGGVIPVSGTIKGITGAGGLFGHYTNDKTEFDLKDYNITATVDAQNCGGVFGVLENNKSNEQASLAFTVKNTSGAGTVDVKTDTSTDFGSNGNLGGIAGKYSTNDLKNSLIIDGLTISAEAKTKYNSFGGAIGYVDSAAYIKTENTLTVNAKGTNKPTFFGGLVGTTTTSRGVFVDLGNFTLSNNSEELKGGGIVGDFNRGVLRLHGSTDLSAAKCACANNCGQLVGKNDNVLVYALGNGNDVNWNFRRSTGSMADDLGTWGEVVRIANIEDSTNGILTFDSTNHTVTIKGAEVSIATAADFAKTALNIQLNQGSGYDCLLFTSGSANTRNTLLASTALSLSSDISLAGTGITGFMRDGGDVSTIGSFTGTFNGNNHTLTLAIGEKYGNGVTASTNSEGIGQIYRHQHNGLFSVLAGTVQNLTVDGTINVSNCVDGMNIGGIASRNSGDITLTNVNANEKVNYNESAKVSVSGEGKNIGGYIGFVGTNGTITINGVSSVGATFNLKGSHENWNVYGGAIGKITAGEFTVNIGTKDDANNKLTNSLRTDISGITSAGSNSDSGGLIGYITAVGSYGSRTVNLNNVDFSSCTVGNAASTNGGGFLGYAWLNTTTNVNGVTVTNGTINNSTAPNVGVMLYSSTGKMKVDSLSINGLTMSAGGGTSLGMIVNKAYSLNDKNEVNGALYLDLLNAGYSLTGTNAPAQATGIFDEIAAYSAPNVINGGAGVISVNMNADRHNPDASPADSYTNVKITETGTYQNRLKTGNNCANPNARYYYNVDQMNSSDDGQNLVLWSLSKYAAGNIRDEFVSTLDKTISGEADLTGLSFYPLKDASGYTIGNLTVTFDYSGIYGTAEGVSNSDSYNRDPAASNQHYLMHSGLFIDLSSNLLSQSANKKLTISGELSLGGTFMEDADHKGVLISSTMGGDINCTGSIKLDGIKPMNGASAYKDGYLLINNVTRTGDLYYSPSLTLKNVYTTNKYSESTYTSGHTNETVAKSLIGAASGKGLKIELSKIKLDARSLTNNAVKSDVALGALYNAYGTYNSIFTDSTLFASIYTDVNALLEYNYTHDEDWGTGLRNVTYGKEVKDSAEYSGEENKYYGTTRRFTNPISDSDTAYDFSSGFLPYVKTGYSSISDMYNREIKVNVMAAGLESGCGSYNDPYIIEDGTVLENIAKFIHGGNASDLTEIVLPISSSNFDTLAKNTAGNRWCTDKNGSGYHAKYTPNDEKTKYVSDGHGDWEVANVRYYLANAYYKIKDIELSESFVGLGGTEANYAFRGVIVGNGSTVVTNNSDKPFINVSNGCVVKGITFKINKDITLEQTTNTNANAYFGYDSQCKYYGGIIGEVMGGDNIIDNSYVQFINKKVTLDGTYGTIVPVGGYVGVVVFGGVIFKNMTAANTTVSTTKLNVVYKTNTENLADNDKQDDWAAIYVNPIVGRVINGYAVNETTQFSVTEDGKYHDDNKTPREGTKHTLKNGTKHYTIADIDPSLDKLDVTPPVNTTTDGTINVPNAQALFILSLITQSGAGTATVNGGDYVNSLSYGTNSSNVRGMSHNATYNEVGTEESSSSDYSTYASGDTAANAAIPYIIKHYTVIEEKVIHNYDDKGWTISFDDNGTTKYLKLVVGDNHKLQLDTEPYYFDSITKSNGYWKIQGKSNNTTSFVQGKWNLYGFAGLADGTDPGANLDLFNDDGSKYLLEDIDGESFYISSKRTSGDNIQTARYFLKGEMVNQNNWRWLKSEQDYSNATLVTFNHEITDNPEITTAVYARCVTSTLGYYDINLTGSGTYQLPDSFRGLGCVGRHDTATDKTNPYSIKLNIFNGKGCTIDEDIYLNKFYSDNYFNVLHKGTSQDLSVSRDVLKYDIDSSTANHGVGLFDSVIMKSGGKFYNFTLSGSVKTAMFSNTYSDAAKEYTGVPASGALIWHSTGGVCGWSIGNQAVEFKNISLNNMIINGSNYVGGLLAHSGNASNTHNITISECDASSITLKMAASQSNNNPRNAMGAFVGKVRMGKVIVDGSSADDGTQSEVTIKSFSLGNDTQNFYVSIGGLVGYSGHGFEAYDMKVSASDASGTTIGNANTGICGGIIGVMQPYSEGNADAKAIFKNCTVQNINVQGDMAGGIYGGKWTGSNWVPYRIEMQKCEVVGKSASEKNSITGGGYAGGLVGNGLVYTRKSTSKDDANILISDCKVSNYNIVSTKTNGYSGGFVGYCDSIKESITCYIHDSSVENCAIGQTGNVDYAGGAVGGIAKKVDNQILGYNIKLDNVTSPSSRMGAWVGFMANDDTTTSIQFTGMAIYGTGYEKNIGSWNVEKNQSNTKTSFVFADYEGKSRGTTENNVTTYPTGISGYNYSEDDGYHVDMPKYPYVNINPQSSMGSSAIITGDGAAMYDASTTMAKHLYDVIINTNTRRYSTFADSAILGSNGINYYLNPANGSESDRISTYQAVKGSLPAGVDNFPVIVITNQNHTETTNLINRYIQLVTNTTTDYTLNNPYYDVVVSTCKYQDGNFVINESATGHGIVFKKGTETVSGSFEMDNAHADSAFENSFTLIDVQFKDPLDTEKTAYHLYVPVYTIHQTEVNFYSAVKTGAHSVSYTGGTPSTDYSSLMSLNGKHVDSLETWITQYIRYQYSSVDINMFLNANDVKWSTEKSVIFRTYKNSSTFKRLPEGTFMILVDPNGNSDKMYYVSNMNSFETFVDPDNTGDNRNGWLIELDKFKDSSEAAFSARSLNDLIAKDIVESTTAGTKLYKDGSESDYDVYRILDNGTKKYYKYTDGNDAVYSLSVDETYVLNEDYYLTMYVPKSTDLFFYEIKAPSELSGGKTIKVNEENFYTVIAADLYTQTTSQLNVSPDDQQINASNKSITARPRVSISINNADARAYLSDVPLYHSFNLSLNRHYEDRVTNEIIGLDTDSIIAKYSIGSEANETSDDAKNKDLQDNYLNIETANIMAQLLDAAQSEKSLDIYGYIELDFDENKLEDEFPQKVSEETIGLNVAATSNLAYDEERLPYTSMSAPFAQDSHYYFRESVNSAKLDYNVVVELDEYDKIGKESQNQSRLGTNGYEENCYQRGLMPINTEAKYNVSAISETDLAKAKQVRLTITLYKKTDTTEMINNEKVVTGVEYVQVDNLLNYLDSSVLVTSGTKYGTDGKGETVTINDPSSIVVDIPKEKLDIESDIYTIGLSFGVKTGDGFTKYSNYKISLNVELIYEVNEQTKTVEKSSISDYIVYTNAKVYPLVIHEDTNGEG